MLLKDLQGQIIVLNIIHHSKLFVMSYNSRGFGVQKQMMCKFLTSESVVRDKIPILCNQENFMLKSNSYKICQTLQGFHVFVKPAVKNSHDRGRPKGGLFIAVPDQMKNKIIDVSPNFWRLQAVIIKNSGSNVLLINSYFPVDPRTQNFDAAELLETLEFIRNIIIDNDFSNLIWIGDIN